MPMLQVVRNQLEGITEAKTPKSGKGRRVPLPEALLPAIRRFAEGKNPTTCCSPGPVVGSCTARRSSRRPVGARPDAEPHR